MILIYRQQSLITTQHTWAHINHVFATGSREGVLHPVYDPLCFLCAKVAKRILKTDQGLSMLSYIAWGLWLHMDISLFGLKMTFLVCYHKNPNN
jgi:hypothetical protein